MVVPNLETDNVTRSLLGQQTLDDLHASLWAIDCQTCGQPFGNKTPSLAVDANGQIGFASLHHASCRSPGWYVVKEPPPMGAHLTWRSGSFLFVPTLASPRTIPMMLVNPSYELATLSCAADGWELSTLEVYVAAGLALEMAPEREVPVPGLAATVDGDRISISLKAYGDLVLGRWDAPLRPEVATVVRDRGSILLGLTTMVDLHQELSHAKVRLLMRHNQDCLGNCRSRASTLAMAASVAMLRSVTAP